MVLRDASASKKVMPLPDCKKGLPYKFNTYEEVLFASLASLVLLVLLVSLILLDILKI